MVTKNEDTGLKLGIVLRRLRNEAGITMRQMNERAGISLTYLSLVENNHCFPSFKMLKKIADVLNVSMYKFFLECEAFEREHGESSSKRRS
jgi:transcriptional regulator with XRE-family HTH domain